jgi:hypothetical protein
LIVLNRDGEEPQTRRAIGGEQALLFAVSMLIECRQLRTGDLLIVQSLDREADIPAAV